MTKNPLLDLLTKGQELIRDPEHWTQGTYAKDKLGHTVGELRPEAHCFCSLGALYRAGSDEDSDLVDDAVAILRQATGDLNNIVTFNDHREHYQVMALWDAAKEIARENNL